MSNLASVVQQLQKERDQAQRTVEQLDKALKALGSFDGVRGRAGGAQTDRSRAAGSMGEMEGSPTEQVRRPLWLLWDRSGFFPDQ
jgi:hypothetical protein